MKAVLRFLFVVIFLLSLTALKAARVDTMNIVHSELHLSVRNFQLKKLKGNMVHHIVFKVSTNSITLDLKSLVIDSVKVGNKSLAYNHVSEKVKIVLDKTYTQGDSMDLNLYYGGTPASDPSGWGGFYFSGDFAFNLGVGFQVFPHSFGRAWMPCVDEFEMKTAYDMFIETDSAYTAACNGLLIDVQSQGATKIWHYRETVPMSAYLAAVSVSKFSVLRSSFNGLQKTFPVELFCQSGDTNKVKASFANLHNAVNEFEKAFGPQPYSKVGYNLVPFTAGAMEHAGNITYPSIYADGTLNTETLMAHELSHHWWGDQVTCRTEADMWLNEGWASYCEHFFIEKMYGRQAYMNLVNDNHLEVMRYAHIVDGGNYALNNIPSSITYGRHVYKKGADVIHSLRNLMGDTVFFASCRAYQNTYRLKNASSQEMKAVFVANGGEAAACFFDNFILTPGSVHFAIEKQIHHGGQPHQMTVITRQKPRFNQKPAGHLPVEIFFFKNSTDFVKRKIILTQGSDTFNFTLDFKPVYVCLDKDQLLTDAITDANLFIDTLGWIDVPEAFAKINVTKVKSKSFLRVEHHWVGPELYETQTPYKSKYRYITVDGVTDDSFRMNLELTYDGRQGATQGSGYLDHTLIFITEDSLKLMHRAYPGDYWRVVENAVFTTGNRMDKQGKVLVVNAPKGDYVFAMADPNLDLRLPAAETKWFKVLPNPGNRLVELRSNQQQANWNRLEVAVRNSVGQLVVNQSYEQNKGSLKLDVSSVPDGIYTVELIAYSADGTVHSEVHKLLIKRS